jgi:hypothetical protein
LRIEEAVGGRVKKGRTKMQVEMIVGTEKIRGWKCQLTPAHR